LPAAVKAVRRRRGSVIEAYPVRSAAFGKAIPAAFAWTGTLSMFEATGFEPVGPRDGGKQRMRWRAQ
jgi:hypothetical protein